MPPGKEKGLPPGPRRAKEKIAHNLKKINIMQSFLNGDGCPCPREEAGVVGGAEKKGGFSLRGLPLSVG